MKNFFLTIVAGFLLYSCSVQRPLYSWYNTEDATYQYTKRGTDELLTKAMAQYELVIKKQKGSRQVTPPGVNAEYGFLLYKAGKKDEGISLMKEEIQLYPESEKYISRIINQLTK